MNGLIRYVDIASGEESHPGQPRLRSLPELPIASRCFIAYRNLLFLGAFLVVTQDLKQPIGLFSFAHEGIRASLEQQSTMLRIAAHDDHSGFGYGSVKHSDQVFDRAAWKPSFMSSR